MTIKNNNEHGQTRYVERYMTDRRFSRIVGSLSRELRNGAELKNAKK